MKSLKDYINSTLKIDNTWDSVAETLEKEKRLEIITNRYDFPAATANWYFDNHRTSICLIVAPNEKSRVDFMATLMVQRGLARLKSQVEKWRLTDDPEHFLVCYAVSDYFSFAGRKTENMMIIMLDDHLSSDTWCCVTSYLCSDKHYLLSVKKKRNYYRDCGIKKSVELEE
jgi:hypothetical protein